MMYWRDVLIKQERQRGNALLITMIVVTVVATTALIGSRLSLSTFQQTNRLDNAAHAYIAANSGIEDGLLRWKFNRNVESPTIGSGNACASPPHSDSIFYSRFNITRSEVTDCVDPDTSTSPPPTDIVYDIKLFHRLAPGQRECVGQAPSSVINPAVDQCSVLENNQPALEQDSTVDYSTIGISGPFTVSWQFSSNQSICGDTCDYLELVSLDCTELGSICNREAISVNSTNCTVENRQCTFSFDPKNGSTVRLKALGSDILWYAIANANATQSLDSRFTRIDVVGYFGGVKRRLELSLDRATGAALPLYDFALFASTGDVGTNLPPNPVTGNYFLANDGVGNGTDSQFVIFITDPPTISQAQAQLNLKQSDRLHVMGTLVKSPVSWNPRWAYHLDPSSLSLFSNAVEVCDASARYVQDNLADWNPSAWCPWASYIEQDLGTAPPT